MIRLTIALFAAFLLAGCTIAVTTQDALNLDAPEQGAFFAISAADAGALADWYVEQLNFERRASGANEEREGILLQRSGVLLEIAGFRAARPRESLAPELESYQVHGIFKFGFIVADVDAAYADTETAGLNIYFPIVAADDGWRTFAIRDPEGNIIQYFGR